MDYLTYSLTNMVELVYTTFISVDFAHYGIFRAKVGISGKIYIFRVATPSRDLEIFDQFFLGINLFGRWELCLVFFSMEPYQYTTKSGSSFAHQSNAIKMLICWWAHGQYEKTLKFRV